MAAILSTLSSSGRGLRASASFAFSAGPGKSALPNGSDGVTFNLTASGVVGGQTLGSANTIAHNAQRGVLVVGDNNVGSVLRNSIFSNGSEGIKLVPFMGGFPSSTDHCDTDTGPNSGQNFPVISSAQRSSSTGQTTIQGTLDSVANTTYVVRFFANPGGTDIEGKNFLGKKSVTTKASDDPTSSCAGTFTFTTTKALGKYITATATDPNGNTSEFSVPRRVQVVS